MSRRSAPEPSGFWQRLTAFFGGDRQPRTGRYVARRSTRPSARPTQEPTGRSAPYTPPATAAAPRISAPAPTATPRRYGGGYGGQVRRQAEFGPYLVVFAVMLVILGGFLYFGLRWATGTSQDVAIETASTPQPSPAVVVITSPVVPVVTGSAVAASGSPAPVAVPAGSPTPSGTRTYVVVAGDNPQTISAQFGITAAELLQANNITDPRTLQVGQTLIVPPSSTR